MSELRALEESFCECECSKAEDVLSWHTSEHTGDFADTSSVVDYIDSRSKVININNVNNHTKLWVTVVNILYKIEFSITVIQYI